MKRVRPYGCALLIVSNQSDIGLVETWTDCSKAVPINVVSSHIDNCLPLTELIDSFPNLKKSLKNHLLGRRGDIAICCIKVADS